MPADPSIYELKSDEVKLLKPKYNVSDGRFLGLIETIGYDKQNSKLLYSINRMKIPNSFRAGLFTRHKQEYEASERLSKHFSKKFFLPATTDRSEEINKHKDQVFLKPIHVEESEFGEKFDPSMLDSNNPKRQKLERSCFESSQKDNRYQ